MDICISEEVKKQLKKVIQQCREGLPHLQAENHKNLLNEVLNLATELLEHMNRDMQGIDEELQVQLELLQQSNDRVKQIVQELDIGERPELEIVLQVLDKQLTLYEEAIHEMDEEVDEADDEEEEGGE